MLWQRESSTLPASGICSLMMMRKSVVFPSPLAPTRAMRALSEATPRVLGDGAPEKTPGFL